jgi:hypothetical protein
LNSVAFLLLFGLFSICSDSKACGPMDVYLTPAGIDCSLSPKPLATVTIGYNACMAAHCDGDIDYLVEVLVGTTVIHSYSTINLVSTFSPCMVFRLGEDECQYYKVRVTMRCNGYPLFMAFENVEGLRQVCNPAP